MGAMTLSATREWDFSSEQGKANYKAAQRRYPAQAIVDLAALRDNMRHLVSVVGGPHSGTAVMGIVKADAYGHGLIPAALAALAGGATGLGTAQAQEALLLRKAGIGPDRCHILTWVYSGAEVPFDELIDNDIDISVGSLAGIDGVAAAARRLGKTARVQGKGSGTGRNHRYNRRTSQGCDLAETGRVRKMRAVAHGKPECGGPVKCGRLSQDTVCLAFEPHILGPIDDVSG